MKTLATLILFFTCLVSVIAQSTKTITGNVKDVNSNAVVGATVKLTKDSALLKTIVTDNDGKFQFNSLQNGNYLIVITAVGQKRYISSPIKIDSAHSNIILPVIVLTPTKSEALANVTVKAKQPLLVQEVDKTVVNVESMISSSTSNTLEILEKTPGVTVNANGEISLNGRSGILVLIDGRQTFMSGTDLAIYLKSLPGAILDKIELMDNPPARYDAAGNAIINIKLKKNRAGGFTGNISTGYSQGKYGRNNDAINLNYNYKKINLFGNFAFNHEKNYTLDDYDRKFYNANNAVNSSILLKNNQQFINNGININVGADYTASGNNTYGFLINLNQNKRNGLLDNNSNSYNANNILDTISVGSTIGADKRTNIGANFNFLHKFNTTGKELSADVNYLSYTIDGNQSLQNQLFQADKSLIAANTFLYFLPSDIHIYTAKADYLQPFKNKGKLEAGFKSSLVDNNNITNYYNVNGTIQTIDNTKSNHFKYQENINAAYVNIQKNWNQFGAQFGLRVENTNATGKQLGNAIIAETNFTKHYTGAFPSLFLSYKLDTVGKNTINFIAVRRLNRPNYQQLNPFLFFKDQYSYNAGNPELTPQYQFRYELRYAYKQMLRIGLSYNRFTDIIFNTTQAIGDTFITRPQNLNNGYMLLLNTSISLKPTNWWNFNSDILLSNIALNANVGGQTVDPNLYIARINVLNQFQIKKDLSAELGAYYASQDLTGQTITSGMFRANAGIQQKILKGNGSIRLAFDDIFHSWIYHNKSVGLKQAQYYQTSETDTQRFGVAFTYRFGKNAFARKSKHNDDASDEEKGRVN